MSLKLDLWRLIMDKIKIEDVCDILNGFAFKSDNYVDKGIRIIRIANVQKGYIEDSAPVFYPLNSTGLDKYMLEKGDLLISLTGNVGRVAILQEEMLPAALNQRVACLRIKSEKISKGYLFHILNSDFFERKCIQSAKGVAQKNMSTEWLKNYKIPLYSTEQQSEIVSVLDTLQSIICNRKYELQMLDNLIKARFVELFGDPATPGDKFKTCKLGEVADVKSSHRVFTTEFVDEGVPFYRGTEIGVLASGQRPEDPYRISMEHYLKIASDDSKPMRGDLLLPSICNKGQVWMVDTDEPFYYKDGRVLCISPNRSVFDPRYLQLYMKMRTEAEYPKLGSGSTFAEFKIFQLKELEVDIPPMDIQNQFADFVAQIDKSKATVQKALDETQLLFDSLMQQYFG